MAEEEITDKLSLLWDGEQHWLEPGGLFLDDGSAHVIDGFEELEEEDVLSPFESPSRTPILRDTSFGWDTEEYRRKFPLRRAEQSWGSLSICLTAFATIAEVSKKQYEHVWPGIGSERDRAKWSFMTEEHITERM